MPSVYRLEHPLQQIAAADALVLKEFQNAVLPHPESHYLSRSRSSPLSGLTSPSGYIGPATTSSCKSYQVIRQVLAPAMTNSTQLGQGFRILKKGLYMRFGMKDIYANQCATQPNLSTHVAGTMRPASRPRSRQIQRRAAREAGWRWRQSRANPSPPDFPVKQGKYREFSQIQGPERTLCGRKPLLKRHIPTNSLRFITGKI